MRRELLTPRASWQKRLEDAGFYFHTIEGKAYWREDACYAFTLAEIDRIQDATDELHAMCLELAADVVRRGAYEPYGFPGPVARVVETSWNARDPSLYGRFDFGYDGAHLKLLEYNADTPTSLPEAAVWQWHWLEDRQLPDQFNSIHEKLVERWPTVAAGLPAVRLYFAAMKEGKHEDWGNVHYLLESAVEAGLACSTIAIEEIGWHEGWKAFTDVQDRRIEVLFKLYPWEFMMADEFGWNVEQSSTRFVEPAWKMLLSTKVLLPLLWQKFPNHPLLLPAVFERDVGMPRSGRWARKPVLAREGANVSYVGDGRVHEATGSTRNPGYDRHGYIYQQWLDIPAFEGQRPVLGSWVVGDQACGMGIREDEAMVTGNSSCFVPHYFVEKEAQ